MRNAVIFCLLAVVAVSAQQKLRVAVLPSVGDLEPQGLILLTDKVREIATKNLPIGEYNILKLDAITKMIGAEELYRACKEGVCIGDLARKTDANYGARCDVIKFENNLVLKFEIYSVNEDAIFETFTDYDVKDFRGMLAVLEARLPATFQKMVYDKALADARDKEREQQREQQKLELERALADARDKAREQQKLEQQKPESEPSPAVVVSQAKVESVEQKPQEKQYSKSRKLEKRRSLEIGGAFVPYSYGDHESKYSNSTRGEGIGGGGYLRIDLIYVEIVPIDGVAIEGEDVVGGMGMIGMQAILAKYPIVYKNMNVSPIFGFGVFEIGAAPLIFGGSVDVGIGEIAYLRSEYLYGYGMSLFKDYIDEGWGASFKIGGGLDMLVWRGDAKVWNESSNYEQPELWSCSELYLRVEFLYNYISSVYDSPKKDRYSRDETSHFHIRLGIGYKWGGKKKPK